MMLFAEAAGFENWIGPVLATAGGAVASLFGWLTVRDKLRFDTGYALLKQTVETLTGDVKECQEDRAKLADRVSTLEELSAKAEGE